VSGGIPFRGTLSVSPVTIDADFTYLFRVHYDTMSVPRLYSLGLQAFSPAALPKHWWSSPCDARKGKACCHRNLPVRLSVCMSVCDDDVSTLGYFWLYGLLGKVITTNN